MTAPVGHAGEEILYALVPALLFLLVYWMRARREERAEGRPERCPYCGADLPLDVGRCGRCGFKVEA